MTERKKLIISYIFVCILGVLLHFTYEWSGENFIVGYFSAVNESTWEHLKLIFYPMLLLTLWNMLHSHKDDGDFLPARTAGILAAMIFTVVAFYTFVGVTGQIIDFVNILIYFIAVAFGFFVEKHVYEKNKFLNNTTSIIILFALTFLFIMLTYTAPNVGIFSIPVL